MISFLCVESFYFQMYKICIKYVLILFCSFFILDTAYREIKRLFPLEWKRAVNDLLLLFTYRLT